MDVVVRPMAHFQMIKISIEVLDINDNPPTFAPGTKHFQVIETTSIGSFLTLPTATDSDCPNYSVKFYKLLDEPQIVPTGSSALEKTHHQTYHLPVISMPGNTFFQLSHETKSDLSTDLKLVLLKPLDREALDKHELKIIAVDGGVPPKTGTLSIVIRILDANDNTPQFHSSLYEAVLFENSPMKTEVVRVHADDMDENENGRVKYSLRLASSSSKHFNELVEEDAALEKRISSAEDELKPSLHLKQLRIPFNIDENSGQIYVDGELDYEAASSYRLIASAQDNNPDSSAETMVIVRLQDLNDNKPEVTFNTLSSTDADIARLAEHSKENTFVAHVTVRDLDSGDNGRVNCSLQNGINYFRLSFASKDAKEFQILTTNVTFDRELIPRLVLIQKSPCWALPTFYGKCLDESLRVVLHHW